MAGWRSSIWTISSELPTAWGAAGRKKLLRQFGQQIRSRCGQAYFAAGLGEDRVAVILPPSGSETAATWCEELLKAFAETTFTVAEQQHRLTASCGLSEIVAGETLDIVQSRVQRALCSLPRPRAATAS